MDVAYINPFIVATRSVFDTMVHLKVMLGKPYLRDANSAQQPVSIALTLSGAANGLVAIGLSEHVALALASGITGTKVAELNPDCSDALKEIANMIVGSAKKDLPGGTTQMGIPQALFAPTPVPFPAGLPVIGIPCDAGAGRFVIEVALRTPAAAKPAKPTKPAESSAPAESAKSQEPAVPAKATEPEQSAGSENPDEAVEPGAAREAA
jgi:chemotaxis protein CheX